MSLPDDVLGAVDIEAAACGRTAINSCWSRTTSWAKSGRFSGAAMGIHLRGAPGT